MAEEHLDVLLIEDNPGDARLIEEMLRDIEDLLHRIDLDGSPLERTRIHHEQRLSAGLTKLEEIDVDVILLDLGLPDSTGLDTLAAVVEATAFVPIVVLTGLRDEQAGVEAIQRGAQDYLVKDEVTGDLLVRSIHYAIERNRQERERARRREQLAALNRLNRIAQDVTHDVITTSTREDLERAVCERLVESDAYRFAWIGEVDRGTDRVASKVAAGVGEGYLDEIDIRVDGGVTAQGPAGNAIRTNEVQVVQNIQTDPAFEPWREQAEERGYRSGVVIPIVHESLLYGILCLYASSPNVFSEPETEILSRLGEVIGHAIAALERREALTSELVLELEFQVGGLLEELVALSTSQECTIESDRFIQSDDALIVFGRADGIGPDAFRDAAAGEPVVDDVRITPDGDGCEFELITTAADSLVDAVAPHGGRVTSATIQAGEFRLVVAFPPGGDRRTLVELVEEHLPDATPVAQRTVERRERSVTPSPSAVQPQGTEKQRAALETAYFSGYFAWPRESTGQDIADRLGVNPSTFTQHLRVAEQKYFDAVFGDDH